MKQNSFLLLSSKLTVARSIVKNLLEQIDVLENDQKSSVLEKRSKLDKIKEEMIKVSAEIDTIKREIKLLKSQNLN